MSFARRTTSILSLLALLATSSARAELSWSSIRAATDTAAVNCNCDKPQVPQTPSLTQTEPSAAEGATTTSVTSGPAQTDNTVPRMVDAGFTPYEFEDSRSNLETANTLVTDGADVIPAADDSDSDATVARESTEIDADGGISAYAVTQPQFSGMVDPVDLSVAAMSPDHMMVPATVKPPADPVSDAGVVPSESAADGVAGAQLPDRFIHDSMPAQPAATENDETALLQSLTATASSPVSEHDTISAGTDVYAQATSGSGDATDVLDTSAGTIREAFSASSLPLVADDYGLPYAASVADAEPAIAEFDDAIMGVEPDTGNETASSPLVTDQESSGQDAMELEPRTPTIQPEVAVSADIATSAPTSPAEAISDMVTKADLPVFAAEDGNTGPETLPQAIAKDVAISEALPAEDAVSPPLDDTNLNSLTEPVEPGSIAEAAPAVSDNSSWEASTEAAHEEDASATATDLASSSKPMAVADQDMTAQAQTQAAPESEVAGLPIVDSVFDAHALTTALENQTIDGLTAVAERALSGEAVTDSGDTPLASDAPKATDASIASGPDADAETAVAEVETTPPAQAVIIEPVPRDEALASLEAELNDSVLGPVTIAGDVIELASGETASGTLTEETPVSRYQSLVEAAASAGGSIQDTMIPNDDDGRVVYSLEDILQKALERNPQVAMALAREEQARWGVREAQAYHYPTVDMVLEAGPEFNRPATNTSDTSDITPGRNINFRISHLLYDGGVGRSEEDRRQQLRRTTELETRKVVEEITQGAIDAYMQILRNQRAAAVANEFVEEMQRMVEQIEVMHKSGAASKIELDFARARLASAQAQTSTISAELNDARSNLEFLTGDLPDFVAREPLNVSTLNVGTLVGYIDEARTNNSDILLNASNKQALALKIRGQEALYSPTVSLNFKTEGLADEGGNLAPRNTTEVKLKAEYFLLDGGVRRARIQKTKAQLQELEWDQERLVKDIDRRIKQSYNQITTNRLTLSATEDEIRANRELRRLNRQNLEMGDISILELIEAEERLFNSQATWYRISAEMMRNYYELLIGVGDLPDVLKDDYTTTRVVLD
ncbi:MAG: TolC family protein [Pseudomonadales bacterium]